MPKTSDDLTLLLLITTLMILTMGGFILFILFLHRRKQIVYLEKLNEIHEGYEKSILNSQLEMQEQTFQHISREIHDNISLSLTLVKLNLNTFRYENSSLAKNQIENSIELLTQSIDQLRDLSKSLDSDRIKKNGLISAISDEVTRIEAFATFNINYEVMGSPVYMNSGTELIIFRIVQEGLNNVLKHSNATSVFLNLQYCDDSLKIELIDNGIGFQLKNEYINQAGLKNMNSRAKTLGGNMEVLSAIGKGTSINFNIPITNGE